MSIKLFDDDGSILANEDPNTHQIFDTHHNQIGQIDHHNGSLNDIHGHSLLHVDVGSGTITDHNFNNIGTISHHAGTAPDQLTVADQTGAIEKHINGNGSITNASGQVLGTFKNDW